MQQCHKKGIESHLVKSSFPLFSPSSLSFFHDPNVDKNMSVCWFDSCGEMDMSKRKSLPVLREEMEVSPGYVLPTDKDDKKKRTHTRSGNKHANDKCHSDSDDGIFSSNDDGADESECLVSTKACDDMWTSDSEDNNAQDETVKVGNGEKVHTYGFVGCFCSWECVTGFDDTHFRGDHRMLIRQARQDIDGVPFSEPLRSSPLPYILEKYNGGVSLHMYRNWWKKSKDKDNADDVHVIDSRWSMKWAGRVTLLNDELPSKWSSACAPDVAVLGPTRPLPNRKRSAPQNKSVRVRECHARANQQRIDDIVAKELTRRSLSLPPLCSSDKCALQQPSRVLVRSMSKSRYKEKQIANKMKAEKMGLGFY